MTEENNNTQNQAAGSGASVTESQAQGTNGAAGAGSQAPEANGGALTLTQAELDKLISKSIETATKSLSQKLEESNQRIKGLETQNMTAEELAARQQKELEEANAKKIAELSETNQRLQIKAKIAETGLPLDENLFINPKIEITDIFKNIDNMAKKYKDDLEKAIANKQSKAGLGIMSKAGTNQTQTNHNKYAEKVPWV